MNKKQWKSKYIRDMSLVRTTLGEALSYATEELEPVPTDILLLQASRAILSARRIIEAAARPPCK